MKRMWGFVGGIALVLTLGVGTASAAPSNANVTTIAGADCDGQSVDLVTIAGTVAWDVVGGRVFVMMGSTVDGVWFVPLVPGQAERDLATCRYGNFGHDAVIYGIWVSDH